MELSSDAKQFSEIFEGETKPLKNTTKICERNDKVTTNTETRFSAS